jgi:Asp-tRNA(Asn)/Glu-tRNA(Gln) amidotransferase A subunit family amidase
VVELARHYSAMHYANAIATIHRLGRVVGRFFIDHDIIVTPAMCIPPLPLGVISSENPDIDTYMAASNRCIGFTSLFNAVGNPAKSVPLHWTASELPVGVQFAAPFGDEATLFRLAAQLEVAKPWRERVPPLAG